jgi:hypothetical protein
MTGTDLCVNKSQFVPVIFERPCNTYLVCHRENCLCELVGAAACAV